MLAYDLNWKCELYQREGPFSDAEKLNYFSEKTFSDCHNSLDFLLTAYKLANDDSLRVGCGVAV